MIRPQPPRLRMKRRKTVSVTPAMGARTVAGEIATAPIFRVSGTRVAGVVTPALAGLSQNLRTWSFYREAGACEAFTGTCAQGCSNLLDCLYTYKSTNCYGCLSSRSASEQVLLRETGAHGVAGHSPIHLVRRSYRGPSGRQCDPGAG